jgi:PAS domain S-box-containing protein
LRVASRIQRIERYLVLPDGTGSAWIVTLGVACCVGLAYFLAARLGLALRPQPAQMAVFWPASGIAAGLLIIAGRRAGLAVGVGVMAGSIAAIILNRRGLLFSALLGSCNLGEALLLSWLLSRWIGRPLALRDLRGVMGFLAAALIAVTITGIGGAAILASSARPYQVAWQTWLPSHLVGIVVVAPLLIVLDQLRRQPPSRAETLEALPPLAMLALASLYAVSRPTASWLTFSETIVMLPPLLWLAARCQPAFAIAGACIACSAVICATTFGIGRFGDAAVPVMDRVYGAQAVVMTLMVSALVLTALFAELKRSNELLRNKETSFRRLLEGLPAAIQTTDTAGHITYCNQAAVELWGKRPVLGKDTRHNLYRLFYPDGRPMPDDEQPCQVSLRERRIVRGQEAFLERADGRRIPIIPCPSPLFDELGRFVGIVNMHLDISERRRSEKALAEREAQLAVFVEYAPVAIAMFDREMRYLAVSRRFAVDYHLPPDMQLIGRSHYEIFLDIPQRWRDLHTRVLAGEEFSCEEDQFAHRDGRTDWVRWSMAPWREGDGQIGGALLFSEVRTDQVVARRALADSEARFRATFENAAVGFALVGPDGSILRVNNSLARMLGYSAEELKTKSFRDITHPDDLEANVSELNKTLNGEADNYFIEKRYVRKDGGIVWANLTVGCVRKVDGKVDYFISVVQDITDRKHAEIRLAERNAQFDLAGKIGRIGRFAYDQATETLQVSPGIAVMHGLPESTLEIPREQWRALVHPDDLPQLDAVARQALVNTESEFVLEFRILRHGEVRWIEARVLISYDQTGRPARRIGAMIDVTEHKLAEAALAERDAQLALAGKTGLVGSYAYDADTEIVHFSEGCAAIHDHPEWTTEIPRSEWLATLHPEDVEHVQARRSAAFRERRPNFSTEYRIVRPGGEVRWVETRSFIVYNDDSRPRRVAGVNIDVTERKQAEQILAERNAQLELAHKAARVGYYTYDISARTMRFSRSSAATYGLSQSRMELTTQQWLARVHRGDMQRLRAEHIRAFKERRGELINEFRFVRPGGEIRWIEARSLIAYDHAGRAERMTGVYIDVTERRKAEEHKNLLIAELDHRVKNVLACVAAVAQRSRECSRSADEFIDALNHRINSLSNTHALLSRSHWQGVDLGDLVRSELAFCTRDESALIKGPDVDLAAEATQPVAIVLHELATNAAKYGSLSNGHGRVMVRWRRQTKGGSGGKLVLEWRETGGPPVAAPNAPGFGTSVIRDLIPYELGGEVDYELTPQGARCRLEIPEKWLSTYTQPRGNLTSQRSHAAS